MTASSSKRPASLFVALLLAIASLPLGCSTAGAPPSVADRSPQADNIRIGDSLLIRITGVPDEQVLAEPIDGDGEISLPNIGRIQAAGKTPSALEREIESQYIQKRIYTSPNITVTIEQRFVSVIGEVKSERRIAFTRDMTALNAISDCGGFTEYANKKDIRILRDGRIIQFNAVAALNNPKLDIPLRAGDQIQVKRTIF